MRLIEGYGAVRVRGPVRPHIDPMLSSLFEVEEHPASEDAEKYRVAECDDGVLYHGNVDKEAVPYNGEYRDEDSSKRSESQAQARSGM